MAILAASEVSHKFQLAKQTDDEVAAASGFKILQDASLAPPSWEGENIVFVPSGGRFPTVVIHGQEWTTFDIEFASLGYGTIVFPLASAANYAAPTGSDPYTWSNIPNAASINAGKSFTVEEGNDTMCDRMIGARCIGYNPHFDREAPKLVTHWIAKRTETGQTLTGSAATVENIPVAGEHLAFYSADTFAHLAAPASRVRILHAYTWDLDVNDLYAPEWPVNDALLSYGDVVEQMAEYGVEVIALDATSGSDFSGAPFTLAAMGRATGQATPIYFRAQAMGPVMSVGTITIAEIVNPGSGYTAATVALSGGGGSGGALTLTASGGAIVLGTLTPGSGYTSHPKAVVSGDGTGAVVKVYVTPCYQLIFDQVLFIVGRPSASYVDGKRVRTWKARVGTDGTNALAITAINKTAAI